MDNEAIAQNLEALMKQVAMLQSYTELKNGECTLIQHTYCNPNTTFDL